MIDSEYNFSENFINEVDFFSNNQLKQKKDLQKIYYESLTNNTTHLFEELSFTAKYVNGLMNVLKSGVKNPEVKSLEHVKKDLTSNLNKLIEQIKNILLHSNDELKGYFDENYLKMTQGSFEKLNELISDLDWTKKFLNDFKRGKLN